MKNMDKHYCINCDQPVQIRVQHRKARFPYLEKGSTWAMAKSLMYEEKYAVCQFCGQEIYDAQINDLNIEARAAEVRKYKENKNAEN